MSTSNKSVSMKRRLVFFSVVLFLLILGVSSITFLWSMQQILRQNTGTELTKLLEIERIKLEASVNGEIAIALKMANSPLIQNYFVQPDDADLERLAFKEIAGYRSAFASNTTFWINAIDKKFYSDDAYVYTVNPDDKSQYWYYMTMNETDKFNFNINYNDQLKKIMLWINAVVRNKGKSSGIVGTGIDISAFLETIYKNYQERASLYFFNSFGEITGARNMNLVTEKKKINDELGTAGTEIMNIIKSIKPGETQIFDDPAGQIAVIPVPVLNWYAVAIMPSSIEDYKTTMTWLFLVMMAVVAVIFLIFNAFIFRMVGPLQKMAKALNQTSIDWDLTRRFNVHRNDEIGSVASSVNNFFEKIHNILNNLRTNTGTISDASSKLSSVSKLFASGTENTVAQSKNVSETTEQMARNISSMAGAAEKVSSSASEVAGAAGQMSASISLIAKNTVDIHKVAAEASGKATDATEVMNKLDLAAEEIGAVTDMIKKISDKTNLLALNATIEAATSGEAGKGFAVVATEIKALANQSAVNADDITKRIKEIQHNTNDAVNVINDVSAIIAKINESMDLIAEHATQADSGAKRVATVISDVAKGANDVSQNVGEAARRTTDVSDSVTSMHKTAQGCLNEVSQVSTSAEDLQRVAGDLEQAVGQFKL